jgi:hypothetical protein
VHEFQLDMNQEVSSDVGRLPLSEFTERFEDTRHELAYRNMMGEQLTTHERVALAILNAFLEESLPQRDAIPQEVLAAAEEGRRLLAKYDGG